MKHKFLVFIAAAICIKFIFIGLFDSFVIAFVLGLMQEQNAHIKSFLLGIVLALESILLTLLITSNPLLTTMLGIFRSIGFQVSSGISYATVIFFSFAIIGIGEVIIVAIGVSIGGYIEDFFEKRGIRIV